MDVAWQVPDSLAEEERKRRWLARLREKVKMHIRHSGVPGGLSSYACAKDGKACMADLSPGPDSGPVAFDG